VVEPGFYPGGRAGFRADISRMTGIGHGQNFRVADYTDITKHKGVYEGRLRPRCLLNEQLWKRPFVPWLGGHALRNTLHSG
jgi:hypothetical protein